MIKGIINNLDLNSHLGIVNNNIIQLTNKLQIIREIAVVSIINFDNSLTLKLKDQSRSFIFNSKPLSFNKRILSFLRVTGPKYSILFIPNLVFT